MTVTDWLSTWFSERNAEVFLGPDDNYYKKQAIDSFDIVELIEDIEQAFEIRFEEQDFQDRRFGTIAGLSELITGKMGDAAPPHQRRGA